MATGRVTKKVLDYIAEVNKQAKQTYRVYGIKQS